MVDREKVGLCHSVPLYILNSEKSKNSSWIRLQYTLYKSRLTYNHDYKSLFDSHLIYNHDYKSLFDSNFIYNHGYKSIMNQTHNLN